MLVSFQGSIKNLNSSLPLGQVALNFCLPMASLSLPLDLVGRQLAWTLYHWASEIEKLPAQKLLVLDDWMANFSSPASPCYNVQIIIYSLAQTYVVLNKLICYINCNYCSYCSSKLIYLGTCKSVLVNIWKILYLNWRGRYEDMIDHHSYTQLKQLWN